MLTSFFIGIIDDYALMDDYTGHCIGDEIEYRQADDNPEKKVVFVVARPSRRDP